MREIQTEVEIEAPPEEVWRVLTDFAAYPEWNPLVKSVSGEAREGARLEIFVQVPDGPGMKFRPKVLRAETARELRWIGSLPVPGLFNGEHFFRLEPAGEGRTRFLHGERFTGLMIPFMGGTIKKTGRGYELMNRALKERVEAGFRGGAPEAGAGGYAVSTQGEGRCPRCGEGPLKAWYELSEEEREVARRLPGAADFRPEERASRHRFCTRCWHEETAGAPSTA